MPQGVHLHFKTDTSEFENMYEDRGDMGRLWFMGQIYIQIVNRQKTIRWYKSAIFLDKFMCKANFDKLHS